MSNVVAEKQAHPLVVFKEQLDKRVGEFNAALPAHIPAERFMRVILTAVQNNPDLMKVDRRSLFNAAVRAAQDGLLPDSREGAIVPYKGQAQWMPMIAGLRKKVRNSGEIATWDVVAVYENDAFEFELGDEPFIRHKPTLTAKGKIVAVYSIATLKTGEKSREVMSIEDVEKIRTKSRGSNTPWNDPIFYPEMAKKTVARRHSKVLPMSTDLDDLLRRDDNLYDMESVSDKGSRADQPKGLNARLDALAGGASHASLPGPDDLGGETIDHDPQTGEIPENSADTTSATKSENGPDPSTEDAGADGNDDDLPDDMTILEKAQAKTMEGFEAWKTWKDNLSEKDRRELLPHMSKLIAAAKQADGVTA